MKFEPCLPESQKIEKLEKMKEKTNLPMKKLYCLLYLLSNQGPVL